jgi:alkylation response protein AidB-like acyl-CoA dehydrogenase
MSKPSITIAFDEPEIREVLRAAFEQLAPASALREAENGADNDRLWYELVRGGWLGLAAPESSSDTESLLGLHLLVLEHGYAGAPAPLCAASEMAFLAAAAGGSATTIVDDLNEGLRWVAGIPQISDDVQFDGSSMSGTVSLVSHASRAHRVLVPVGAGPATAWYAIDPDASGVQLEDVASMGKESLQTITLIAATAERVTALDGAKRENVLSLRAFFEATTIAGLIWRILDMTVSHAATRHQFGRAIGSFQAVQHKLANMTISGQALVHLTREAALMIAEHGAGSPVATASIAEAVDFARRAARTTAQDAHQTWAGAGVSIEFDLQLYTRRLKSAASRLPEADSTADDILTVRFPA